MNDHGLILAIEISNPSASASGEHGPGVALGRLSPAGVELLGAEPVHASGFGAKTRGSAGLGGHDDDLMPAIDRLVARIGADIRRDLALVAVSAGPGGYTSVRVACAAGKMIAAGVRRSDHPALCVRVPTALVLLESAPPDVREGIAAVALAGKGDSAWIECFARGTSIGDGQLTTAADLPALVARGVRSLIADRFLPDSLRASALAAGIRIIEPIFDAAACARIGARLPPIEPEALMPIYPREPDAVTLWRTRSHRK